MAHVAQATSTMMKKISTITMEASPYRTQAIHYINLPVAFNYLFGFAKNFFGENAKLQLHVHSSLESLYEYVPQKFLPTEYGGEAGSMEDMIDVMESKLLS
jgi:hypothetical protein